MTQNRQRHCLQGLEPPTFLGFVGTAEVGAEKRLGTETAIPQRLNSLLKKSNSNAQPLKGNLISNDLRYR